MIVENCSPHDAQKPRREERVRDKKVPTCVILLRNPPPSSKPHLLKHI